MKNILIIYFE